MKVFINRQRYSSGLSAVQMTYVLMLAIAVPALLYVYFTYSFRGEYIEAQAFNYPDAYLADGQCEGLSGRVASHETLHSKNNIRFNVTTPTNYRGDFAHPLLGIGAPSGFNEKLSERFTGLTGLATAHGYIVVHAASVPLGMKALSELGTIPAEVMARWCIDADQVFYTGHSDGGTASNALAVMTERLTIPTGIAPSAMGMQGKDMSAYECPDPLNVMLMHNQDDKHFPGYGSEVAAWWANCNQCGESSASETHPDCVEYQACADGVRTLFCQAEGNHANWPGFHHDVVGFFDELRAYQQESLSHEPKASSPKP